MVVLCPSCNSTETIFDYGCQCHCCSACGLVLDDDQVNKNNIDSINEDTETATNVTIPPFLEARYRPIFEQLQSKFNATNEETDFVRQLCFHYLSHPERIFENSALEVVLCLFYLVVLQHLQDQSLLLPDYCQLVNGDSKRCLTIYAAIRLIVSTKLATLPSDYDPQYQLDNVMRFLYPALLQSTPSSPTLQHQKQQQPQPFFSYHETPLTAYKKTKRNNKNNQQQQQQQQRKRQKISATSSSITLKTTRAPLSPLPSETTITTDLDRPQFDANTNDDTPAKLGPGEPLIWPTDMNDVEIRQQTTRLMTVAKRNGLADGRYGRPLMAACLLITMLGWFHRDQRQNQQSTTATTTPGVKKLAIPKSRSASLLPVVMIHWDELCSHQLVNSTTKSRYKEMVGLLHTFGKTLPWIKDNLSMERDVLHYLDDILQMMDVLQTNNNKRADEDQISTRTKSPSSEQISATTPSSGTATPPSPGSSSNTPTSIVSTTDIGPFLPPSFERATRVRQKRRAELDAFDRWNHAQQQQNNDTATWKEDLGLTDSVRMVASLITSQQYDREAILAMSDGDLVKHSYRFASPSTTTSSALDLDRQLDDFDLSKEELASYLV